MRAFEGAAAARRVLLIGLDGLRWSVVEEPGIAPALTTMREEGAFRTMTMEAPTISGPGWASILTGTTHAQHGIRDNSFIGHRLFEYPDVLSRAFYQDTRTRTFAAAGWPPLVSPTGLGPIVHERAEQQKAGLHRVVARDGEVHGYTTIDNEVCHYTRAALNGPTAPDVSFVYFCGVDDAGHVHGLLGPEYREALTRVDEHVGVLLHAVTARQQAYGEDWLVLVVTDHGHVDQGGHGGDSPEERASFLLAWSPEKAPEGIPAQVAPHEVMDLVLAHRAAGARVTV